jgi:fatty acid synthase subunit alpha
MRAIFPDSIDGDLLKLVHLSNSFRIVPGAKPLKAGDVCRAEARIASVINSDGGKTVKVKGTVYCDGEPVIEVMSSFLYRGCFTDFENTFEIVDEPDYIVTLSTPAEVGVLNSKEWFQRDDDTKPLLPGTSLTFRVQSDIAFADKAAFSSVSVTGDVFVRDQLKQLIKVATVDHKGGRSLGNVVLAYLQRHGQVQGQRVLFDTPGYSLMSPSAPTTFASPATNQPYSNVSGDFNPIHVNPYFSDFASLPGTITHGMWSSAATRKYVETVVAQGHPERVRT